ncbi:MAG: phosphohistidine phosphatase [Bermanella sp.]|jgi:phosphohistidine phosphatase
MECVFVRHGEASLNAATDFDRELTVRGLIQVEAAAAWLAKHLWGENPQPARLLVSPYRRAQQTAAAFLSAIPSLSATNVEFLTPETALKALSDELALLDLQRLLLIGHNPLFSNAISWFCGDDVREAMAPASMALIDMPIVERHNGRLAWLRHAPDYSQVARQQ